MVAQDLLGKILVRETENGILAGKIVETEAYTDNDPACHAYKGKTARTAIMFDEPGLAYVYFIYGMYHCLNTVTEAKGKAGAVLIRAIEPFGDLNNTNGPGKLCKNLHITKELNGIPLTTYNQKLWIEYEEEEIPHEIIQTTRIGISVAQDFPWRFYIKDNKYVSKK